MPPVDVPFPTSNAPGGAPNEGTGRLLNCFAYKEGDTTRWRALPGLSTVVLNSALPFGTPRGFLLVGTLLYVVIGQQCVIVDTVLMSVSILAGAVGGSGPVTMERNNNIVPDVVIVSSSGPYIVAPPTMGAQPTVQAYPDSELPTNVNSVTELDGYFLFTTPDGTIWSSGLNTTTIFNAAGQPSAKAEARPDGLFRGIVYGPSFLAMGSTTIEVWQDAATIPFPLARQTVIPCGLYGPWAVAGAQDGWTEAVIFVAADSSVRRIDGYTPTRISPDDLDRLIEAVVDPTTLIASVYTFGSNAIWSLSSPDWTWEYNVTTNSWHERQSQGLSHWRAQHSVSTPAGWVMGDLLSNDLLLLNPNILTEAGVPVTWGLDSGPVKQFPIRIQVPGVQYDFVLGQAPQDVNAQVALSWSHDGGQKWSIPLLRSLGSNGGGVRWPIRLHRIGLATHSGTRHRFRISDPVYTSFAGARSDVAPRRA